MAICTSNDHSSDILFPGDQASGLQVTPPINWQPLSSNINFLCSSKKGDNIQLAVQGSGLQVFGRMSFATPLPSIAIDRQPPLPLSFNATNQLLFDIQFQPSPSTHSVHLVNNADLSLCIFCFEILNDVSGSTVPASSTTLGDQAAASSASSPSSSAPSGTAQSKQNASKTGAIIAVCLGLLFVLLLGLISLWWYRRRRRRRLQMPGHTSEKSDIDPHEEELRPYTVTPRSPPRYFASPSHPSVSSIPQPPHSVEPPSTASSRAASVVRQVTNVTVGRIRSLRQATGRRPRTRQTVLRAVNV